MDRIGLNELWQPADRRPIYDWAHDNVVLPSSITKSGLFDISGSRYLIKPFESLLNDAVREVVVVAPVRSGKSLIGDVWLPWIIANDPGPTMWNMQTDPVAADHAETRVMPILESCAKVRALFPVNRHQKRSKDIVFAHGMPLWIQGPSVGNLQSKGIRYQINDEVWMWEQGRLAEAKGRLGDYEEMQTSKLLIISQAGSEDDDLDAEFQRGTRSEWHVTCQSCGHRQRALWEASRPDGTRWGMLFDLQKDSRGDYRVGHAVSTRRFSCEKCGHDHTDDGKTRAAWNLSGDYVAADASVEKIHSYHYTALITRSWDALVEEYVHALNARNRGVTDLLVKFWQKRMAEPKSEGTVLETSKPMTVVSYEAKDKWDEETHRFMTIDRQEEDLYWWTVRAWTPHAKSRRIGFGKAFGAAALDEIRKQHSVPPNYTFIDSGFLPKGDHGVYAHCVRYGWIAFKGEDSPYFIHTTKAGPVRRSYSPATRGDPESGHAGAGKKFATLIRFASNIMKDRVNRLIDRGLWIEPTRTEDELEIEYRKQMASEFKRRKRDKFTGREQLVYVCPSRNNHAFDCASMQVTAATILKLIPDQDASELVFSPSIEPSGSNDGGDKSVSR